MSKEPYSIRDPTHPIGYATTREWEEKKEQDKVEEVDEAGVCGKKN